MYYHRANVHWWREAWWFSDETEMFNGPYETWNEAALAQELYVRHILNGEKFVYHHPTKLMAP